LTARGLRRAPARSASIAAAALGAAVAVRSLWEPRTLRVRHAELAPPGWPASLDGLRVAAVADLHAGTAGVRERGLDRVVAAVRAERPDLVALLGDFVDPESSGARRIAPYAVAERLATLEAPLGVVAVLGNHDWLHAGTRMRDALAETGIAVLENSARSLREDLWVVGLADPSTRVPDIGRAFAAVPDGPAVICLAHDPDLFPYVPDRAALTLSGHTHGGQVNVPLLRRAAIPSFHGDRYAGGHVVEDGRHLYVSRGIGTSRLPVRFGAPPEVVLLHLRAGA
jgi:predicted MPP superfamily phosphohydrolase